MSNGTIRDYGKVKFDPINLDSNVYDLYAVAICDPETDRVISEEHYTSEDEYHDALYYTYGRELMDEQEEFGMCEVTDGWGTVYDCECTYRVAYVIDSEDE